MRESFAYVSWQMFWDRPIWGCGFGHFYEEKLPYLSDRRTPLKLEEIRDYIHHNTYLSLLTETGVIGLGLFLAVLACWIRVGWQLTRDGKPRMGASPRRAAARCADNVWHANDVSRGELYGDRQFADFLLRGISKRLGADRRRKATPGKPSYPSGQRVGHVTAASESIWQAQSATCEIDRVPLASEASASAGRCCDLASSVVALASSPIVRANAAAPPAAALRVRPADSMAE